MRIAVALLLVGRTAGAQGRFNCPTIVSPPLATNVTALHPAHVDFVAAMGDSITAAFAVRSSLYEGRDISWSAGVGSADHLTLPYLLQQFNKRVAVQGASTTEVLPVDIAHMPHNDYHPKTDFLNVAESSGAVHRGSMEEQWAFLNASAQQYDAAAFKAGWKVLTVWMTANDVCGECDAPLAHTAYLQEWTARTNAMLLNVSQTFERVYVNLISTLDLSNIARIQKTKAGCAIEHRILNECGCIDRGNATQLAMLDTNVAAMNAKLHGLAQRWRAKLLREDRWDMAVVVQPFQERLGASLDWHWLNTLDCFHPSELGHETLAIGLWNSMLCDAEGRKTRCGATLNASMAPHCPTPESVFYTGPDVVPSLP